MNSQATLTKQTSVSIAFAAVLLMVAYHAGQMCNRIAHLEDQSAETTKVLQAIQHLSYQMDERLALLEELQKLQHPRPLPPFSIDPNAQNRDDYRQSTSIAPIRRALDSCSALERSEPVSEGAT